MVGIKSFIGCILIFGCFVMLMTDFPQFYYLENDNQKYIIANNLTNDTETINISFNFDIKNINSFYENLDNSRIYKVYLNVITQNITDTNYLYYHKLKLNDCIYSNISKAYITSFGVEEICLNDFSQNIEIEKNASIDIDQINLEYKGANQLNRNNYTNIRTTFIIIIFLIGFALIITDVI